MEGKWCYKGYEGNVSVHIIIIIIKIIKILLYLMNLRRNSNFPHELVPGTV